MIDSKMTPGIQTVVVVFCLLFAHVLQGRVAHAIEFRGAHPDLPLIVLACGATLLGGARGTAVGLWSGLLTASIAGVNYGSLLASRTIAGAFAGNLQRSMLRDSIIVPPLIVFSTTVVAEFIYAVMAPNAWLHHWRLWMRQTGGEVAYNMVLSYPIYFLLRRIRIGHKVEDPFALHS
ncbi:MAG: hypothetical protein JWQ02_1751 [Capsulimonas sp.]|jgi:rod shape-determining protein MreD|nr:hypothetical protein [Capsulimonas sp.]